MLIEIKHRYSCAVLYRGEHKNIKEAVESAVKNRANLDGANLDSASLNGASLNGASLNRANLNGASLDGANLNRANLTPIRDDLWAVLCSAPAEVHALRDALAKGQVNGSVYKGDCGFGCLVGTLAIARGCTEFEIPGLRPNADRPAERFFLAIKLGDTPETSQFVAIALGWVDDFLEKMRAAFGGAA